VNIAHFLNCNKVKALKVTAGEIADANVDSEVLEISKDKLKVRRVGNPELPEMEKKRDAKAGQKAGGAAKDQGVDEYDENGKVIMVEKDFSDPLIIYYKGTSSKEEFKVNWKSVDAKCRELYKLKFTYARGGTTDGHLSVSSLRLNREILKEMCDAKLTIDDIEFTFEEAKGECLKDFW